MKVLFVYKYLTLGGCETVLRARLDGLAAHGIDARAWFLHDGGGRSVFRGLENRIDVGSAPAALVEIERGGYDIVSTLDTEEVLPLFRSRYTPRLIVEVHSPYLENIEYLRRMRGLAVAEYLVPSAYQGRIVRERVGEGPPIRVCPNPLREEFAEPPAEFPAAPRRPVVAWVGRLDDLKNWKEMLKIAGRLVARRGDVDIWLAGRSPDHDSGERLLDRARREGVLAHLRWFRGLPHDRVPALLDAVRGSGGLIVSTSRGESFGMTVAEAMSRACAVVVPRYGPFPEFVEHDGSGVFYEPGEIDEAVRHIEMLLDDAGRRRRLGDRARAGIIARYGPRPAVAALAEALQAIAVPPARLGAVPAVSASGAR